MGIAILGALVAAMGCGTDEIKMPVITGPATYGIGVQMRATPDIMFADGQSTALVVATVSDSEGRPLAGKQVTFLTGDDKVQLAAIGTLSVTTAVTGSDGKATTVFTTPSSREWLANQTVSVMARVTGENAASGRWPYAKIELVAVDQRRWPAGETETPECLFTSDPRWGPWYTGVPIHFMTRATDADGYIVQYLWRFSDDETKYYYATDLYHTFAKPGDYVVFHSCLDNSGHVDSRNFFLTVDAAP